MVLCVVGGQDRPIPQPKDNTPSSPRNNARKDSLAGGTTDIYSRLGSAVSERGQMLDGLEDTVNSLRTGSENMLAQVRYPSTPEVPHSYYENRRRDLLQSSRGEVGSAFDCLDAPRSGQVSENGKIYVTGALYFPVHFC